MGLLDLARADIKSITASLTGFAESILLTNPQNNSITIQGLHSKHHLGIDTEGNRVNVKNAHVSFSESLVIDQGLSIRNIHGEVNLKNWRVAAKDSTGIVKQYSIKEWYPSETTGLIVCILEDFE
jgi:hypothetical protein